MFSTIEAAGNWGRNPGKKKATHTEKGKPPNPRKHPFKFLNDPLTVYYKMQDSIELSEENNRWKAERFWQRLAVGQSLKLETFE